MKSVLYIYALCVCKRFHCSQNLVWRRRHIYLKHYSNTTREHCEIFVLPSLFHMKQVLKF